MTSSSRATPPPSHPGSPAASPLPATCRAPAPADAAGVRNVVVMGAAGRDFHNFNVLLRDDPAVHVVAFTAAQIPDIDGRCYPAALAGPRHPDGVPILAERELTALCRDNRVHEVIFSYSDVSHETVMQQARGGRHRRAYRLRQVAGHPAPVRGLRGARHPPGGGAPPHALRRPCQTGGAALRQPCGHGRSRLHGGGARGIRTPGGRGHHRVRRGGLRAHPGGGASWRRRRPRPTCCCGTAATTTRPSSGRTCT